MPSVVFQYLSVTYYTHGILTLRNFFKINPALPTELDNTNSVGAYAVLI